MSSSTKCVSEEDKKSIKFLDYFTTWTLILYLDTILFCFIFPNVLPLWFWLGVACQMITVGIIGTFFFTSVCLYNGNDTDRSNSEVISSDFFLHILPVIVGFSILFIRLYANIGKQN